MARSICSMASATFSEVILPFFRRVLTRSLLVGIRPLHIYCMTSIFISTEQSRMIFIIKEKVS